MPGTCSTTPLTTQLLQPTAMLPTGRCHITFSPVKIRPLRCGLSSKFYDHLLEHILSLYDNLCSGAEHMKVDVDAVHKRICHFLAVIRTPSEAPAFVNIEEAAVLEEDRKNEELVGTHLFVFVRKKLINNS